MFLVIKRTIVLLALQSISFASCAQMGMAFSSGEGIRNIIPYRFSLSWDTGPIWPKCALWGLNVIWENSFAYWDGPSRPELEGRPTDLYAATTGPMLRWQRQVPSSPFNVTPYIELGVGLSWLSETQIQGRILSLHFQFEDKIGVGMRFGENQRYDISVRAYHYSNASIKRPNSGVNLAMMSVGMWFS